jgi:hypothetical protein
MSQKSKVEPSIFPKLGPFECCRHFDILLIRTHFCFLRLGASFWVIALKIWSFYSWYIVQQSFQRGRVCISIRFKVIDRKVLWWCKTVILRVLLYFLTKTATFVSSNILFQRPVHCLFFLDTYMICVLCQYYEIWLPKVDPQWRRRNWSRIILEPSGHMFWTWHSANHLFVHKTSDLLSFRTKTCVLVAS